MRLLIKVTISGVAVVAMVMMNAPAVAASTGPVSRIAATWTPRLATSGTDGTVEKVRQLVPCRGRMYAVGTFTRIFQGGRVYTRLNAFSFSATTGAVSPWNPRVRGLVVDSIALSADCSVAYLAGQFSAVGDKPARNIAAVSTATGTLIGSFAHRANKRVAALVRVRAHVLAGGFFTSINGSSKRYLVSLNRSTGRDDGYVNLHISGNYRYADRSGDLASDNPTRVWNYARSPTGSKLLVMGDFTSVGGVGRRQMFMLDLGSRSATVDPWYPKEFDQDCATVEPFWLQAASWSPDATRIYIATTGYKPATGSGYYTSNPRTGLCDAVAAFSSSDTHPAPLWVNYSGCDSLFSTAADASTVYVGGHERWADNPDGCDFAGRGAAAAPGMGGFNPTTGRLSFDPTRARGQGADDEVITSAGLWIASDNAQDSNSCGKTAGGTNAYGHAGICFLPYNS